MSAQRKRKRRGDGGAIIVAAVITAVATLGTVLLAALIGQSREHFTISFGDPPTHTVTATPPTETVTAPAPPAVTETVTVTVTHTPTPTESPGASVSVTAAIAVPVGRGERIGPDLYRLTDGEADIAFGWEVREANVAIDGDGCQVRARIDGPGDHSDIRSSRCTGTPAGSFGGSGNGFTATSAGDYRIIVEDELSGATGERVITIQN